MTRRKVPNHMMKSCHCRESSRPIAPLMFTNFSPWMNQVAIVLCQPDLNCTLLRDLPELQSHFDILGKRPVLWLWVIQRQPLSNSGQGRLSVGCRLLQNCLQKKRFYS